MGRTQRILFQISSVTVVLQLIALTIVSWKAGLNIYAVVGLLTLMWVIKARSTEPFRKYALEIALLWPIALVLTAFKTPSEKQVRLAR